jgi:phosphatidylserine/phosphatidylglycerophosphate/cardiolipin synthase-like enzyme
MDMGVKEAGLTAVSRHPNVEVRLFNPFPSRGMRLLDCLRHFGTVTRRMRNKFSRLTLSWRSLAAGISAMSSSRSISTGRLRASFVTSWKRTDPDGRRTHLGPKLPDLLATVKTDLILVSPSFVPRRQGKALLRSLVKRGCRVTVLTNSLAATDVPAVNAGFSGYRRSLIEAGVEIYEMRPAKTAEEAADVAWAGREHAGMPRPSCSTGNECWSAR